jgi:ribonucleoside-triphosphate reductase
VGQLYLGVLMSKKGQLPEQFQNVRIPWGPIGENVYKRSYSQVMESGKKETYQDTVVRAVDGNLSLVPPTMIEADERDKLIGLMLSFAVIPAGRHLNASGMKNRQYLFNCHAAGWDADEPSAHFGFTFDELMMGGGVGSNYSNRYIEKMPEVAHTIDLHIICDPAHPDHHEFAHLLSKHDGAKESNTLTVDDSREGWVECPVAILKSAFNQSDRGSEVVWTFDVSNIRRRGSPLKTSGGIACGPGPLVSMLRDFVSHLNGCIGRALTSLDAMTLDHNIAACVVAGGKRRSSRIAVKNWNDHDIFEFINCKREDGVHWSSNISVEVDDEFFKAYKQGGKWARDVMRAVVLGKRNNGEPGIWNRSLAMKGEREPEKMFCPNPCGEIGLQMWENCNLGHVNLEYFARKPKAEMFEAFRLMTRWLVRATFGDIPQARQREVVDRNRRIGVGFFGYHAYVALRGGKYSSSWKDPSIHTMLMSAHGVVQAEALTYSSANGIPCPVKNTTLAPTGTVVLMPGTTSSGQCMMTPWGKRLVRYSVDDPELAVKRAEGYEVFPDDDAKNTDIVVYWFEDPLVAKVRAAGWDPGEILEGQYDVSFSDSLNVQKMFQELYADNSISFTINMLPEKMPNEEEMEALLMEALPSLKGTTVFPEKSRKNSPIQPVTKEQFESFTGRKETIQVEDVCKNGCPVF